MSDQQKIVHNSMEELYDELETCEDKWIKSKKVRQIMMQVDRADFAPTNPYQNFPQPIPCNVVISAPLLHAYCLEAMKDFLKEGNTVLDVGFGSGYLTVAMSKMMNDKGCVIGIEHMPELYDFGIKNISKHHKQLIDDKKIILKLGEGRTYFKEVKCFQCIHVGACALEPPKEFLDQLDVGGRLVIPLGTKDNYNSNQFIYFIDKLPNGQFNYTQGLSVRYVDLTTEERQRMGYV